MVHKPLICLKMMQDLEGCNDRFCINCWWDDLFSPHFSKLRYLSRQECVEENCVTEEEFDEIEQKRHMAGGIECHGKSMTV